MQIIMEQKFDPNDSNQEAGEEQLSILIKQAGNDARLCKPKIISEKYNSLQKNLTVHLFVHTTETWKSSGIPRKLPQTLITMLA
jgi:hypothetical protein